MTSARVLATIVIVFSSALASQAQPTAAAPASRVMLDAHNAYPYNGQFADRIDRALATGLPVAIEQDLVWRPAAGGKPARSIVSHGEPFDDTEPSLRDHFFERIRPIVERALRDGRTREWPLITLNLDLKSNEPEHHRALWDLLGEYDAWLTTAVRTVDGSKPAPLDVKPVLVLTGEADAQERSFHDAVPIGARLRLFGAMPIRGPAATGVSEADAAARFWQALPATSLPHATNYRRWWNAPWSVIEAGGQVKANDWTASDDARLRTLVRRAHDAGLWVRLWTLNGLPVAESDGSGWSASYNFGSLDAVAERWKAAIAAGVDFVATDQYQAFVALLGQTGARVAPAHEILLEGTLTESDRLRWLERTFEVPEGTTRIDVDTSYTDRDRGTALEFGLYDPARFRGASRFSKTQFFVSRTTATPSYYPGELPSGTWRLLMGVPSIRSGVSSTYRIVVRMTSDGPSQPTPLAVSDDVAATGPRWYQGDLHTHTMHSDGFGCADGRGGEGPCAPHLIADAARRRGLDFVAITDHNTTSHHADMVALQVEHERLLLLRGQEMTTFFGHANVYGTSEPVDFRIGHEGITANDVFEKTRLLGALVTINHPARETGERCTGCGWNAPGTDYSLVDAIEVVNGRVTSGPTAGEPYWQARLNEGHRLTGVGGSDDHGAATRAGSAVGTPTTVIHAESLTESGLLAGIRAGRVYIKTRGPEGPDIRFSAPAIGVRMGDVVLVSSTTQPVSFRLDVEGGQAERVEVIRNGTSLPDAVTAPLATNHESVTFDVRVSAGDWVRVNLRDAAGVTVIGNPIYFR